MVLSLNYFFRLASNCAKSPHWRRNFCSVNQEALHQRNVIQNDSPIQEIPNDEGSFQRRGLPITPSDYKLRRSLKPSQPPNSHILKVTILGEPNAGKSTLTNALVKWKVCAVSKKVHTTRNKVAAIFVEDEKQIIFLDTPGFISPEHGKKHKLEVSLVIDPENSIYEADLITVVVDVANKWINKRIHEDILEILDKFKEKKSILVLNKVDAKKQKHEILDIVKTLTRGAINGILNPDMENKGIMKPRKLSKDEMFLRTEELLSNKPTEPIKIEPLVHYQGAKGWPFFSNVFMVSALKGEGIDDLRKFYLESAQPGEWVYHGCSVMDKHPHEIAVSIIRQVLLEDLPQEIPYSLELIVRKWDIDVLGCLKIHIAIKCPKEHYKSLVIGRSGNRIAKFTENGRQALQDAFRSEIYLKLGVE